MPNFSKPKRGSWSRKFLSKSPFKAEGAVDAVTDKISGVKDKVASVANVKDKLSSVRDSKVGEKLKSKVTGKVIGKGVGKTLKQAGAKRAASLVPGVGVALAGRDAYKFLDKHQVGQKSVSNIGRSSGRQFLGKM